MNKSVLYFLLVCCIGYPNYCTAKNIKFQYGRPKYSLKEGDVCYTEDGQEGTCILSSKCSEIQDLIKSRGGIRSKGTVEFIRRRICGFTFKDERVCCLPEKMPCNPEKMPDNTILPSLDECGLTTGIRIVDGEDFEHGTHPWLVGIGYMQDRKSIKVECGGTLITKRHVLSAAHCFDRSGNNREPNYTHVILGEHNLSENTERISPIILKIADRRNPGYNLSIHYKDIELLTLEKDVEFNRYIYPACLPFKQYEKDFNFRSNMTVAGWGRTTYIDFRGTNIPKQAKVPWVPLEQCKEAYEMINYANIDETQICLGGNGKDTCRGDSGGPVIFYDKLNTSRFFVIGITAFGVRCADPFFPGVYTYVPKYLDWIINNL